MTSGSTSETSFIRLTRKSVRQNINETIENKGKVVRKETEVMQ